MLSPGALQSFKFIHTVTLANDNTSNMINLNEIGNFSLREIRSKKEELYQGNMQIFKFIQYMALVYASISGMK